MLKNGLLSKVFIVIFLTLLNASFSYAEEENTSNPLAKNNDASICSFINELASPKQKYIDEANRRGLACSKVANAPLTIPANSTLIPDSDSWTDSNSWTCDKGYKLNTGKTGCVLQTIPTNSHKDGASWTCNTNYYKSGSACRKVPANAYSSFTSNFWYCNDGYKRKGMNCEKSATYKPLPEKAPESSLNSFLMIGVFLFILFNVAFKFGMSPKPTIKLRPFPRKKPSTPSSEESSKPLASQNRPEVKAHSSDFDTQLTQQTETIKSLRADLSALMNNINDMSQTFMTLKTSLDQKDEEISRYKNGYDATIFKNFLLRFTRVDKVIKEYVADNKIDLNGLQDIQIQMDDALAECEVEIYTPEIGLDYKSTAGLADNPETRETLEKSKDATIAEVLIPGYRHMLPNDGYQIIVEAKVAIHVYKKNN